MKKYIEINGGGWSDVLKKVIKIYNNLPNRSTYMKPIDATFIINKDIMFQETNCGNLSKNNHHN